MEGPMVEEGEIADDEAGSCIAVMPSSKSSFNNTKSSSTNFPNPNAFRDSLRSDDEGDMSGDSDESDEGLVSKKRRMMQQHRNISNQMPTQANGNNNLSNLRKKNVWADVILEQQISSSIEKTGTLSSKDKVKRGIESYQYTAELASKSQSNIVTENCGSLVDVSESDDLWNVTEDGESKNNNIKNRVGKKNNAKSRLGKRTKDWSCLNKKNTNKNLLNELPDHVTADDDEKTVAKFIAYNLNEPKTALTERVVWFIGRQKALDLFNRTQDVESVGGMQTHDGKSRRTPGGVFLHLLKSDKDISKDTVKDIFSVEKERQKQAKKEVQREKRRRKYGPKEQVSSETKTQTQEIIIDIKASGLLCDSNGNNEADAELDEFDYMEEPDIQIGVC